VVNSHESRRVEETSEGGQDSLHVVVPMMTMMMMMMNILLYYLASSIRFSRKEKSFFVLLILFVCVRCSSYQTPPDMVITRLFPYFCLPEV
jgi:ABC-type multidrug transport system permease subunit